MPATYRLPADGYVFQAPIYGRNFRAIPSEEWDTEIPTPEARANATFIGARTIDGSACAVFSTGCAVFLACTLVAAQVAP